MNFQAKRILIVGASGALGAEFARQLALAGANVLGTASSVESAERVPASATVRLVLDLANDASVDAAAAYIIENFETLDGIVLAAGIVGFGGLATAPAELAEKMMRVNYLNQVRLIGKLLPLLTESDSEGRFIAGISGVVAEKAFPGMLAYSASKTALSSALKSLQLELRRSGITVTDARPGHTETGLAQRAAFGAAPAFAQGMSAEHVVQMILKAVAEGKTEVASSDF